MKGSVQGPCHLNLLLKCAGCSAPVGRGVLTQRVRGGRGRWEDTGVLKPHASHTPLSVCVCTRTLLCKRWELYVPKAQAPDAVCQWDFQPEGAESVPCRTCKCSWAFLHMNQLVWLEEPLCSVLISVPGCQRCPLCDFAGAGKKVHGSSR